MAQLSTRQALALLPISLAVGMDFACGQEPEAKASTTATATTKQIRVSAEDPHVRAAFGLFADDLGKNFSSLLGENGEYWKTPIEIKVTGTMREVVEGRSAVLEPIELTADGQFRLAMRVRLHTRYEQTEARRELLRLLLYEAMLRPYVGRPDAFTGKEMVAPAWLIRGIDELLTHRAQGRPSDLYAGIVRSRQILSVTKILGQMEKDLDPVSEAVFSASAAALISTLLSQEQGAASFRAFLGALPGPARADTGALLREHFPGLRGSADALEKWWSLEIASLGQLQAAEFLSPAQTEESLDAALAIVLVAEAEKRGEGIGKFLPRMKPKGAFTGRVHDFEQFLDHPGAQAALGECRLRIQALVLRGFPLYRSLLGRYERAVTSLLDGRERGVAAELKALDTERDSIRLAMGRVTDYMNYYEATQAEGRSEAYEQYREIREKLERQPRPPKNDRITRYLDALEKEFGEPVSRP